MDIRTERQTTADVFAESQLAQICIKHHDTASPQCSHIWLLVRRKLRLDTSTAVHTGGHDFVVDQDCSCLIRKLSQTKQEVPISWNGSSTSDHWLDDDGSHVRRVLADNVLDGLQIIVSRDQVLMRSVDRTTFLPFETKRSTMISTSKD